MREFKLYCSEEQTKQINELLGENRETYSLADVFNILPNKIQWGDRCGYLNISKMDILYTAVGAQYVNSVTALQQFVTNDKDVYDAFIEMLRFFKKYDVKILEK